MGYCMQTMESTAILPKENFDKAVQRLKVLSPDQGGTGIGFRGRTFAWISPTWNDTDDIAKMFREWRYEVEPLENGDLWVSYFMGEKYGDDLIFFNTISDLMDGYIQYQGEDGAMWRFQFGGPRVVEIEAKISWS